VTERGRLIDKTKGAPVDRVAARVTSRSKDVWSHDHKISPQYPHWEMPPKMRSVPENGSNTFNDMTGIRKGYLTVLGLFDSATNKKGLPKKRKRKAAVWVVQCDCGRYELRFTRAIRNLDNKGDRCLVCWKLADMKRHRDYLDGQPEKPRHEY
jgi:hypothetical protein